MGNDTPLLVLFDIDGTLVHTGGAGLRGMNAAFARLYGWPNALEGVSFAGRTDRSIAHEVYDRLGRPGVEETEIFRMREAYLEHLGVEMLEPTTRPFGVLPGVTTLIDALEDDDRAIIALLTGNFEGGAAIKLGHFDLWRRFGFGAFGDHHVDRRDLVPVALEAARRAGHPDLAPSDVVVIGDTPLDIDCARAHGARSVGVATGPFTIDALVGAGADLAVAALDDPRVLDALTPRR
jgi:phosphoglycolate phosphatase-like HAD superfamily hydrolase